MARVRSYLALTANGTCWVEWYGDSAAGFSYGTPIVFLNETQLYVSKEWYSRTTSKHKSQLIMYFMGHGTSGDILEVEQEEIDKFVVEKKYGVEDV